MTAFVCILDRSGAEVDPAHVDRLAEPLASYGSRLSSVCRGPVAVAVRHEAARGNGASRGPIADFAEGGFAALAGGLALVGDRSANGAAAAGPVETDWASLARDAFRPTGSSPLAGTVGSFVLISAEPHRGRLSLARDHLGDFKAYYHLGRRWFIAASEPAAILRHPAVSDDLDELSAARFLGFRFYDSRRSFFRQIEELQPAHQLQVTSDDCRVRQYWRFRLDTGWARAPREAILKGFRGHLRRSIAGQTSGLEASQVGLSLSGGLDSTSLAALAPTGVRAFSWHFGEAAASDERPNIEAVAEHLGTPVAWIDGTDLHPLCPGYEDRFVSANSPHLNAFAALKHALYQAARAQGCRTIMVGDAGDALYSAQEYWLRDTLAAARPRALGGLVRTARKAMGGDLPARRALRRLLPLPAVRGAPSRRLPWLTEAALSRLPGKRLAPILPEIRRRRRYELIAGAKHSELESEEQRLFAQCGIGRSSPFWHWPLLEMVMQLPAWWYHDDGRNKVLTVEAMRGLLPEGVLESGTVGLLGHLFLRGIELRRRDLRQTVFRQPRSDWQRYVRRQWLEPYLEATGSIRFGHTILWRVICYELWQRHLLRS